MHGNVLRTIQHCKCVLLSAIMKLTKSTISEKFLHKFILFSYFIAEGKNRYSSRKSKDKKIDKNIVQHFPSAVLGKKILFFIGGTCAIALKISAKVLEHRWKWEPVEIHHLKIQTDCLFGFVY